MLLKDVRVWLTDSTSATTGTMEIFDVLMAVVRRINEVPFSTEREEEVQEVKSRLFEAMRIIEDQK